MKDSLNNLMEALSDYSAQSSLQKLRSYLPGTSTEAEEGFTMKKSTFAAILAFLAAATGALVAAWLYIRRREQELDEYEQLLFSDDFDEDFEDDEQDADEAQDAAEK